MRKLFFASLTLFTFSCYAQEQSKPNNNQPSSIHVFMGYIIKVNPNTEGGYGYDILYMGKPLLNQKFNPFNHASKRLSRKEDAIKIAQWQIGQLAAGTPASLVFNQPLPMTLARELNISID